jgi:hypothetical protein
VKTDVTGQLRSLPAKGPKSVSIAMFSHELITFFSEKLGQWGGEGLSVFSR